MTEPFSVYPAAATEPGPGVGAGLGRVRRPRSRAALTVLLSLTICGVLVGGLWAWIAPPVHAAVAVTRTGEHVHEYLGSESEHLFVAPFLMLGLLSVVSVVTSVLTWQWRYYRGPGMVVVVAAALVVAGAVAAGVGVLLVRLRYGAGDFDSVQLTGHPAIGYVTQPPPVFFAQQRMQVAVTLLWPVGIASMIYALLAAANARDDLGATRWVHPEPALGV